MSLQFLKHTPAEYTLCLYKFFSYTAYYLHTHHHHICIHNLHVLSVLLFYTEISLGLFHQVDYNFHVISLRGFEFCLRDKWIMCNSAYITMHIFCIDFNKLHF